MQRFLSRADEPLTHYRALRRLEGRNDRFKLHGWLEAWTELTPDGHFKYEIAREGGSEYIRSKALRSVLENEQKLFATGDPSRSAMTPANYELQGMEAAEPGLVKLLVKPKRREVSLIEGAAFVTEDEARQRFVANDLLGLRVNDRLILAAESTALEHADDLRFQRRIEIAATRK